MARPSANRRVVLVAEDEPAIRNLIRRVLAGAGYDILLAGDAPQALEYLEQNLPVDILLTDLLLPAMDGRELAARATAARPGLRVLFISGLAEPDLETGSFLAKPFTPAELTQRIAEMV